MKLGIPKELVPGERRVALIPETVGRLGDGVEVVVESGAGEAAGFPDEAYREAGASIGDPWTADVVAKVAAPTAEEAGRLHDGQVLIAFLSPLTDAAGHRAARRRQACTGLRSSRCRGSRARSRWMRCRRRRRLRGTRRR